MSTKTTFKRVALATVAALGFGLLSVVPTTAAINNDSLTVSSATATQSTIETLTATSPSVTLAFLGTAAGDSISVTAALVSGPAGTTALPYLSLAETSSVTVGNGAGTSVANPAVGRTIDPNVAEVINPASTSAVSSAKYNVYLGTSATAAPSVAGTYVVRITPAARGAGALLGSTAQLITFTVSAATQSSALSTAHIARGVTAPDATTDLLNGLNASSAVQTAAANAAANIKVTQLRSNGVAASESITATITGAGQIGCETTQAAATAAGRSLICKTSGGVGFINVFGDGTAGVATITLVGTTSGQAYGTKRVLFSGTTIATLTAKAEHPVVSATGTSKTDAVSVVARDSSGNQIYAPTVFVSSSNTAVLSDTFASGCTWSEADLVSYCNVTPVAAGTANITIGNRASAVATTPTTSVVSNAVAIRVGSVTPATAKLSFDKTSYAPGEKATLTLTLLDAAGNAVAGSADNSTYANTWATGGISSDYAFYTGSDTLTATFARVSETTGLQTWTLYMPLQAAELTVKAVPGSIFSAAYQAANTATTTTITAKATVGNSAGVDAATDAANEATDAANAATDAALAAADAADAATAAAQDASDAVAALSASVSKLISSLRAQITSLTNLVIKIQKKVRA